MKKNKKGFTLVELIVVMALMGIIMGAVMLLMKPTNDMYSKVDSATFEESVSVDLSKLIGNEIKYARKVSVVGYSASSIVVPTGTNYILIDNVSQRPSAKKNATGFVTKGQVSGGTLTTSSDVMNEAAYGYDSFKITVGDSSTQSGKSFLQLDFTANPMMYSSGTYVNNTNQTYKTSKSITFTNINRNTMLSNTDTNLSVNLTDGTDYIYIFYELADVNPTAP